MFRTPEGAVGESSTLRNRPDDDQPTNRPSNIRPVHSVEPNVNVRRGGARTRTPSPLPSRHSEDGRYSEEEQPTDNDEEVGLMNRPPIINPRPIRISQPEHSHNPRGNLYNQRSTPRFPGSDNRENFNSFIKALFMFDGSAEELQRFLYIGDCAMEACSSREDEQMLIRQVLVHLNGATYNKCALYKTYGTYVELRQELIRMCGTIRTVAQIQDEIGQLKQERETLMEYGSRATQLLSELMLAAHSQFGPMVAEVNRGIYEEQVVRSYIRGLPHSLRLMVAAGRHNDLTCVKRCAEGFLEGGFVENNRPSFNSQRFNNPMPWRSNFRNDPNYRNDSNYRFGSNNRNYSNNREFSRRDETRQPNFMNNQRRDFNRTFANRPSNVNLPNMNTRRTIRFDDRTFGNRPNSQSTPRNFGETNNRSSFTAGGRINMLKQRPQMVRDVTKLLFVPLATDICERPVRLLLDTGADVTVIKEEVIEIGNITAKSENIIYGREPLEISGSIKIRIPTETGFLIRKVLVTPSKDIPGDGILGLDFFGGAAFCIDTKAETVTFEEGPETCSFSFQEGDEETNHTIEFDQEISESDELSEVIRLTEGAETDPDFDFKGLDIVSDIELDSSDQEAEEDEQPNVPGLIKEYTDNLRINQLLHEYKHIMYNEGDVLTATDKYEAVVPLVKRVDPETGHLIEAHPVYTKPYPVPNKLWPEVIRQVEEMERDGIIRRAEERVLWNSPVHMVTKKPKPDGTPQYRLVVDYRNVNKVILEDHWPLPRISDLINRLSGTKYFSTIDLKSGYHQIKFRGNQGEIAAFSIPGKGQYIPNRLLFGLKTSPAQFQRMMDSLVQELPPNTCMVYIDDLLVYGKTPKEHFLNLKMTLDKLSEYNLKINTEKSHFLQTQVTYLGYVISEGKIAPDESKFEAIKGYPAPTNKKELQRFLGLANYYRRFLPNLAKISLPMTELLKKGKSYEWHLDCQGAFEKIKEILINSCALFMPDFNLPFTLTTDASEFALGAVLSQQVLMDDERVDRPIAYDSRVLSGAEKNYSTIEKELLALIWATKVFRSYLYGQKFTLITDHKPLTYLNNLKIDSARLTKMRLKLMDYDFEIKYKAGSENVVADALSRIIYPQNTSQINAMTRGRKRKLEEFHMDLAVIEEKNEDKTEEKSPEEESVTDDLEGITELDTETQEVNERGKTPEITIGCPEQPPQVFVHLISRINHSEEDQENSLKYEDDIEITLRRYTPISLILQILKDFLLKHDILQIAMHKEEIESLTSSLNHFKTVFMQVFEKTNITVNIVTERKIIRDKERQMEIIRQFHDHPLNGHLGVNRTCDKISQYYSWSAMRKQVREYIKKCGACQRNKICVIKPNPMQITTTASEPMETIFMDVVGPMNTTTEKGNKYILTFLDDLTKFLVAVPIPNHEAETVSDVLVHHIILPFGTPASLVSDNAPEFVGHVLTETCKMLQLKKICTTPYHPQANRVERVHRDLKTFLRIYGQENPESWDVLLPFFVHAHNTSVHSSTKFTPFELMFGRKANLPNVLKREPTPIYNYDDYVASLKFKMQKSATMAKENMIRAKEMNKKYYDQKAEFRSFNVGEWVAIRNPSSDKFAEEFQGPYRIERKVSDSTYIVKIRNRLRSVNIKRIRPFFF